jgi:hypothetical protein
MQWPPVGGPIDPLASWPPVMTYAACIPPTPFKVSSGGMPQSPVPTAAVQPQAYDPFNGLPAGGGLFGNPSFPLTQFQAANSQLYVNPTSLIWGKGSIPSPEYVREIEQQNIILWSTQKQLSKILLDEESQKWLKLLQVSMMTALKLNPVQQLTVKAREASFTEDDVYREADHLRNGATSLTAREYVNNVLRQNRLLFETQALVNSIFTNPDTEKWAKKSQASITTILNLNRIEKLVMKSKDPNSLLAEQPNANPYANPASQEVLPHSQTQGHSPLRDQSAISESKSYEPDTPTIHAAKPSSKPSTRRAAAMQGSREGQPSRHARNRSSLSFIDAHHAVAASNERSIEEDPVHQIEQRNLNAPADVESLTRTISEAVAVATPRGRPDEDQLEPLPEARSRRRAGGANGSAALLSPNYESSDALMGSPNSGSVQMHEDEGMPSTLASPSASSEQVYVYMEEDDHHPSSIHEEGTPAPAVRRDASVDRSYEDLIAPLPSSIEELPAPRQRRPAGRLIGTVREGDGSIGSPSASSSRTKIQSRQRKPVTYAMSSATEAQILKVT